MPFKGILALLAVAVTVAACGNLPRPFSPERKVLFEFDALLPDDSVGVVVDEARCSGQGGAVIEALNDLDIPATEGSGTLLSIRLVCKGYAWWLIDGDDVWLGQIKPGAPADMAEDVLVLLGRDRPQALAAERPIVVVTPVAGAPGDGAQSLTRAMALALKRRGMILAETPGQNTLLIMGSVVVSGRDAQSQLVEIIWELLSADGARLGVVSQENTIDADALDGAWGAIALVIASAGADGVAELIERTK